MWLGYSALFSLLFLITRAYGATQPRLVSRDNLSLLSVVKGGMLIKNGNLTSCELAVIDNTVSITAASCLDYISPSVVDPNSLYFVYLDNGLDGRVAHYQVTNVTVHPAFNPTTHVNDIAILQYNNGADVKWQNAISPAPDYKWDQIGFVRVVPKDLGKQEWNGFKYDFTNGNHDDTCDALSQIYTLNSKDMVCTGLTVNALSTNFSNCAIPLGTAYGLANNKAYIIGSYAYSAINEGDSFCSYVTQRSYYTLFANYMGFITATLGRQLTIDNDFFKVDMSKFDPDYRMADSNLSGGNGLNSTIIGGNFYKNQIADSGIAPSLDEMMEPNPDDGEMGDLDSLSESEEVSSKLPEASSSEPAASSEGLSNKDTIIVAVCASLGGAVIIGLALLIILWYKRRRKEKKYPAGQSGYQDIIASEIGGAMVRRESQAVSDFADTAPMQQGSSSISTFRRISLIPHTADPLYHNDMPPVYNEEAERANVRALSIRDAKDEISQMKGGVLGKNGKVTSCELAVIDNKAAIAAASCLDYTSGTTLDKESKYIAYLDKGNDGVQGAYFVDTITVHPKFNPKNYVNNIAILEFNKDSDVSMQNQIAPVGPGYSWNETAYVRVVLNNTNMENMQFNYREGSDKQDDTCTELSGMYTVNMDDMMCTQYLIASVVDSQTCDVPMGTVYGYAHNGKAYTIGLYSYTSLYQGDSLCKSSQERSYYTALYNYLGFIHKTLNRDIKIDSSFFDKNISDFKSDYSMVDRDFSDETVKSTTIISGNFYGKDDSSISTSSGDSSDSDSASDSNINDSSEGQSNPHQSSSEEVVSKEEQTSSEGLSNTQVVIIAVCVPVGVVIIAFILLIIFWRRYQHRKHGIDPVEQTGYQEAIEADIGGAVVPALSSRNRQSQAPTEPYIPNSTSPHALVAPEPSNIEIYHADLPPVYEETMDQAVAQPLAVDSKNDERTSNEKT
ncbi:hypothetical protein LPJ79_002393 [Coemansia sp. RSA 1821]|nr:hypothetical protein LPJ79_002393 [Coemansia sp. RSA 1821]